MHRIVRSLAVLATLVLCGNASGEPTFEPVSPGVERAIIETHTRKDAPTTHVWVYRSTLWNDNAPRACVLIAASGATGITGMSLSEDDVAEHIPYVAQGCIVVAYETDGAFEAGMNAAQYVEAVKLFIRSDGGVENAKAALAEAKKIEPRIDEQKLFVAGHGAAANVALLVASKNPNVRAAVAFAPMCDVIAQLGDVSIDALDQTAPGLKAFLQTSQPLAIAEKIDCPTMLFHAADDSIVPIEPTRALAVAMTKAGNTVFLTEPKTGGHVQAMLNQGLTNAAAWVGEITKRMPTTKPAEAGGK